MLVRFHICQPITKTHLNRCLLFLSAKASLLAVVSGVRSVPSGNSNSWNDDSDGGEDEEEEEEEEEEEQEAP